LAGNDSVDDGKRYTEPQDETGIVVVAEEQQGIQRVFDESSPPETRSNDIHYFEPSSAKSQVVQSSWWNLSEQLQTASPDSNHDQEVPLFNDCSADALKSSAEAARQHSSASASADDHALPKDGNNSTSTRKPDATWADHSMFYWTRNNEVAMTTPSNKPQNNETGTEKSLSQEDEPECQAAGQYLTMPWTSSSSWLSGTTPILPWKETTPSKQLSSLISGPSTIQDDDDEEDCRDEHMDCTTSWLSPGPTTTVTDDEETRDESILLRDPNLLVRVSPFRS
jgi:hypothetical protein